MAGKFGPSDDAVAVAREKLPGWEVVNRTSADSREAPPEGAKPAPDIEELKRRYYSARDNTPAGTAGSNNPQKQAAHGQTELVTMRRLGGSNGNGPNKMTVVVSNKRVIGMQG